mgnify:CR=1 FL=1
MEKKQLIKHLENDIYCRIGISKIHGVGVIAIKDIKKGTNPFKNLSDEKDKIVALTNSDLRNVDSEVKKIVNDFFGNGRTFDVLYYGPNYINISYYLNHSKTPNLDLIDNGEPYLGFSANRDIKKNEELLINYDMYEK